VEVLRMDQTDNSPRQPTAVPQAPAQPPDSTIQLAQSGDTLTVLIPPNGFRGMTRAMLSFSILWNVFIAIFITVLVLAATGVLKSKQQGNPVVGALFMIPFVAVGIGTMLGAINSARRRTVLLVTADSIIFTQKGLFGEKEKQWPRASLLAVAAGPSGAKINEQPVLELQLQWTKGKHFGLLAGRPEPELQWLAAELRRRLLPPTAAQ
jgi:hypothetical protein